MQIILCFGLKYNFTIECGSFIQIQTGLNYYVIEITEDFVNFNIIKSNIIAA